MAGEIRLKANDKDKVSVEILSHPIQQTPLWKWKGIEGRKM